MPFEIAAGVPGDRRRSSLAGKAARVPPPEIPSGAVRRCPQKLRRVPREKKEKRWPALIPCEAPWVSTVASSGGSFVMALQRHDFGDDALAVQLLDDLLLLFVAYHGL